MKRGWIVPVGAIALITSVFMVQANQKKASCGPVTVTLPNQQTVEAEIALTPAQRAEGLSGRDALPAKHGMLFLFSEPSIYSFWMQDTHIPLDIIWLHNKKIVELTSLPAHVGTTIPSYTPQQRADAVLELNQGEANSLGLTIGSQLDWPECQP